MCASHKSHKGRWIALAALGIILAALLFPMVEGLSTTGFLGDKTYLVVLQDNSERFDFGCWRAYYPQWTHNTRAVLLQPHKRRVANVRPPRWA